MQKDKVLPGTPTSQQDPAEGSREIVERELRRQQEKKRKDTGKDNDKEDTGGAETKSPPLQGDVLKRAELALDVKAKAE